MLHVYRSPHHTIVPKWSVFVSVARFCQLCLAVNVARCSSLLILVEYSAFIARDVMAHVDLAAEARTKDKNSPFIGGVTEDAESDVGGERDAESETKGGFSSIVVFCYDRLREIAPCCRAGAGWERQTQRLALGSGR